MHRRRPAKAEASDARGRTQSGVTVREVMGHEVMDRGATDPAVTVRAVGVAGPMATGPRVTGRAVTGRAVTGLTVTGLTVTRLTVTRPVAAGPLARGLMPGLTGAAMTAGPIAAASAPGEPTTAGPSSPRDRRRSAVRQTHLSARRGNQTATRPTERPAPMTTQAASFQAPMREAVRVIVDLVIQARPRLACQLIPGHGRTSVRTVGYGQSGRPTSSSATCLSVVRIHGVPHPLR